MGLVALALAVLAYVFAATLFPRGTPRIAYLALVAGFGFWYWLPAANLLTVGFIGLDDFEITPAVDAAAWLTLSYQVAALALLALARPLFADRPTFSAAGAPPVALFAVLALGSAVVYLVTRFASQGDGVLIELALGLTSAREGVTFTNRSSGIGESLRVLWEILTIWTGLFAFGWHVAQRRALSLPGSAALAAMTLMFVGTGTRAVLLQAIFVTVATVVLRAPAPAGTPRVPVARRLAAIVPAGVVAALVGIGFSARFSADTGYAAAGPLVSVASTFFVNNDMMRELAFTLDHMAPMPEGARDYLLTPFTYLLPAFLGFQKSIPTHVIAYNQLRAGIDVEFGAGNVFPGIVADFRLAFGAWGAPMLALFVTLFALAVDRLTRWIDDAQVRLAFGTAAFAYLFFSFRNVAGSLAMVLIFGIMVVRTLQYRARHSFRIYRVAQGNLI